MKSRASPAAQYDTLVSLGFVAPMRQLDPPGDSVFARLFKHGAHSRVLVRSEFLKFARP